VTLSLTVSLASRKPYPLPRFPSRLSVPGGDAAIFPHRLGDSRVPTSTLPAQRLWCSVLHSSSSFVHSSSARFVTLFISAPPDLDNTVSSSPALKGPSLVCRTVLFGCLSNDVILAGALGITSAQLVRIQPDGAPGERHVGPARHPAGGHRRLPAPAHRAAARACLRGTAGSCCQRKLRWRGTSAAQV
jgi:hypothetical protein